MDGLVTAITRDWPCWVEGWKPNELLMDPCMVYLAPVGWGPLNNQPNIHLTYMVVIYWLPLFLALFHKDQ